MAHKEKVTLRLEGITPLLMHSDNIDWSDAMEAWMLQPANKGKSKAGDDRSPAFRWIGYLYFDPDTKLVSIPCENIMAALMGGAAEVVMKGHKTFKSLSQSAIQCLDFHWPLLVNGAVISMDDVNECQKQDFRENCELVRALGFSLFVKRAKIGTSKHVRVRPRFDNWSASGDLLITDKQLTVELVQSIAEIAGRQKGIGDWRPSSSRPGRFGMFSASVL